MQLLQSCTKPSICVTSPQLVLQDVRFNGVYISPIENVFEDVCEMMEILPSLNVLMALSTSCSVTQPVAEEDKGETSVAPASNRECPTTVK